MILHTETIAAQATPAALDSIHSALDRTYAAVDSVDAEPMAPRWRDLFRIGVAEIAANIIRHAYPPSTTARPFEVQFLVYRDHVVAEFIDRGVAWEPTEDMSLPDPLDLPEGGLGLAVARGALDEMTYRRRPDGSNVWRLTKQFVATA